MKRTPAMQKLIDTYAAAFNIQDSFIEASDHPYNCRCDSCRQWWKAMGPDDDDGYGPFTVEEIECDGNSG